MRQEYFEVSVSNESLGIQQMLVHEKFMYIIPILKDYWLYMTIFGTFDWDYSDTHHALSQRFSYLQVNCIVRKC